MVSFFPFGAVFGCVFSIVATAGQDRFLLSWCSGSRATAHRKQQHKGSDPLRSSETLTSYNLTLQPVHLQHEDFRN